MTQINYVRCFKDFKWSDGYIEVSEPRVSQFRLPYTIKNIKQVETYLKEFEFKKAEILYKRLSHKYPLKKYLDLKEKYLRKKKLQRILDTKTLAKLDSGKKGRDKNMTENIFTAIIKLDNREYKWDGKKWIDLKSHLIPPGIIILKLNEELSKQEIDYQKFSLADLKSIASNFKDNNNFKMAQEIIDYALSKTPGDSAFLSILCSLLRKMGKPREALERTDNYNYPGCALLTSRAAAMCDLELWEDAKKEVGRALAIAKDKNETGEAFNVVERIKAARLDLYE